jgi:hypothetical protein
MIASALTGRGMLKIATKSRRLGRPLMAVVVAYAIAVQSLLVALGGFSQFAAVTDAAPAFELCHHDADGAPASPAHTPDHSGCNHCIFCFAGAHQALIGPAPFFSQAADIILVDVTRVADTHRPPTLPAYSIAEPRGPPLRA